MPQKVIEKTDQNVRLKEITDKLEQGIKDLFEGQKFKEYLNTMSKFHNYSFNNTMLITLQKPNATHVAGFNAWKSKFERHVSKGEKGISIFAPAPFKVKKEMEKIDEYTGLPILDQNGKTIIEEVEVTIPYFKVVRVFDVSQTYGKELPMLGVGELSGDVREYDKLFEALKTISPVPIIFEEIESSAKGYFDHGKKIIAINEGMSEIQNIKTAIHEIAHAKLHDRDLVKADLPIPGTHSQANEYKDKSTKEVEAESVAYTVCQHFGIDTSDYSFAYVASWGANKEMTELKSSLETIRATANDIINKIDEQIHERTNERSIGANAEQTAEKPTQNNIIGNTPYKDIADKKYFKVDSKSAGKITAGLEILGVKFSGRVNGDTTTFTINKADVDKFREVEKTANAHKIPPKEQVAEQSDPPEKPSIIGNAGYSEIADKKYFKLNTALAVTVAAELEKQGVKFSGRISGDMTTITIGRADEGKYRDIVKDVKAAEIVSKIADKMPDIIPAVTDKTYSFEIFQLANTPENRDIRFATLKSLDEKGVGVNSSAYDMIYKADIIADGRTKEQILEDIYTKFNVDFSDNFKGHSLSVSDVVVMVDGDERTAHYCDNIGFSERADFFTEKANERDNSAPTVSDLENQVKNGESISLMDLAGAVKNENKLSNKPAQKPSIRKRLRENADLVKSVKDNPAQEREAKKGDVSL